MDEAARPCRVRPLPTGHWPLATFRNLSRPPEHRAKPDAVGRFCLEESFLEPARPTSGAASLPTDTVDLATLLGTHGRLRGKEDNGRTGTLTWYLHFYS